MNNPLDALLRWLPAQDFAMVEHRFAKHGRDYIVVVEDGLGTSPGQTDHVHPLAEADFETRVQDGVGPKSWADEFTGYKSWTSADEPEGYVCGTNQSLAYPGLRAVSESARLPNGPGDLARRCLMLRWRQTDFFCA